MNNPIPLEYVTSFSQTSQAMMQQLATGLLTSGDNTMDFTRYSEFALVQQNYLQQMGAVWLNSVTGWRLGAPDEIAGLIIYLCSEEAAFVTGADIANQRGSAHAITVTDR